MSSCPQTWYTASQQDFYPRALTSPHLLLTATELGGTCVAPHKRVAIAAPRGHAKSTAITKCYTLAATLFRTADYILIVSDTYNQACLFLGEIKRELIQNQDLVDLFELKKDEDGNTVLEMDRENDIIVAFKDGHQFRITALGSEQKVRGLLWNGRRPNLIVGDDLENDEIVMNPERRDKFKQWIQNALLPCLVRKGPNSSCRNDPSHGQLS
jgi:hypothetical protein